jgi:hypothetical protein
VFCSRGWAKVENGGSTERRHIADYVIAPLIYRVLFSSWIESDEHRQVKRPVGHCRAICGMVECALRSVAAKRANFSWSRGGSAFYVVE